MESSSPPPPSDVREQIAEALGALNCSKFDHPVPDKSHPFWVIWREEADAVLRVPVIAEALADKQRAAEVIDELNKKNTALTRRLGRAEAALALIYQDAMRSLGERRSERRSERHRPATPESTTNPDQEN